MLSVLDIYSVSILSLNLYMYLYWNSRIVSPDFSMKTLSRMYMESSCTRFRYTVSLFVVSTGTYTCLVQLVAAKPAKNNNRNTMCLIGSVFVSGSSMTTHKTRAPNCNCSRQSTGRREGYPESIRTASCSPPCSLPLYPPPRPSCAGCFSHHPRRH